MNSLIYIRYNNLKKTYLHLQVLLRQEGLTAANPFPVQGQSVIYFFMMRTIQITTARKCSWRSDSSFLMK